MHAISLANTNFSARIMSRSTRTMALAALVALPVLLPSCNLDIASSQLVPIEETDFASSLGVNLAASTRTEHGAYYRDIAVGTGAVIVAGQTANVHYTGWLADGTVFDSSFSTGATYEFQFGTGDVIPGWDEALIGMRVGGQRQLIIPPALGYGNLQFGPIPPNSILVFNVELVSAL